SGGFRSIRDKEPVFAALACRTVVRVPAEPYFLAVDGGAKLRLHPTALGFVLRVRHVFPYRTVPVDQVSRPVGGRNGGDDLHTGSLLSDVQLVVSRDRGAAPVSARDQRAIVRRACCAGRGI